MRAAATARAAAPAHTGGDEIAGVRLTHPERVLYPDRGITKGDLAGYYLAVAERMLPHLEGRPISLVRCPDGTSKPCFFQRHGKEDLPEAIERVRIEELKKPATYLAVKDVAGLVGLVQMGTLEIHAWGSRADRIDAPDRLVFDLDPDPALPWMKVVEAALLTRLRLEDLGLESFVKTTGGKGLHVVVPILRKHGWDEVKEFCRALAEDVARTDPGRYTTLMSKDKRPGKIYLDWLRNVRLASSVAAYSTRARPGAPVSAPVHWDELPGLSGSGHYTVENLPGRLASLRKDPWAALSSLRQSITRGMMKKLGS
jgi:bifunctional non-homologous end joining protein LigD